jgi:hypothetical protein
VNAKLCPGVSVGESQVSPVVVCPGVPSATSQFTQITVDPSATVSAAG